MRHVTFTTMVLLAGCTATGSVCKSDAGPDTTITDAGTMTCTLPGTWVSSKNTITFSADNTFTATLNGTSETGTWTLAGILGCGAVVTIGDSSCGAVVGMYGINIDPKCKTMSLSGQGDDCGVRAGALSDTQYKKQ